MREIKKSKEKGHKTNSFQANPFEQTGEEKIAKTNRSLDKVIALNEPGNPIREEEELSND